MKKVLTLSLLFLTFNLFSETLTGKVIKISDGDTITVLIENNQSIKIRLYGIDAPEKRQDFGQKAKQFISNLIFDKKVKVDIKNKDRYGRSVALVYLDSLSVNESMIENGYAWVYIQYCKEPYLTKWLRLQAIVKQQKRGLWSGYDYIAPWEFRKMRG